MSCPNALRLLPICEVRFHGGIRNHGVSFLRKQAGRMGGNLWRIGLVVPTIREGGIGELYGLLWM